MDTNFFAVVLRLLNALFSGLAQQRLIPVDVGSAFTNRSEELITSSRQKKTTTVKFLRYYLLLILVYWDPGILFLTLCVWL